MKINKNRSWAEINLENLKHNFECFKKNNKNSEILCMTKANAYGHGSIEISKFLQELGCEHFGVATVEEGIELRAAGTEKGIYITGGFAWQNNIQEIADNKFIIFVSGQEELEFLNKNKNKFKIFFKFDTGMSRFGFQKMPEKISSNLELMGICSHLASNLQDHKDQTREQRKIFNEICENFENKYKNKFKDLKYFSLTNTGNSLSNLDNKKSENNNLIRIGLGLYGYGDEQLKPVLTWKTKVLLIKDIKKQDFVGYGFTYKAQENKKIAILGVGYADGFNRLLSNKGHVLIHGKKAPVLGRVSMDSVAVDISKISNVKTHDEAVIIGQSGDLKITANDIAELTNTISYEVLTSIGNRVARLYLE